jgi:hypothetical protein
MLLMFATSVKADRILYQENYEVGSLPSTWTINGGTGSIAGDTEGKYMSFALGQNNGRSAHCLWGAGIYDEVMQTMTEYKVSIDFQIQAFGTNQYNGEIAVFSGDACEKTNGNKGGNWDPYNTVSPNCFFDISQDDANIKAMETKLPGQWFLMGNVDDKVNLTQGTWYTLVLNVNVNTREVAWTLDDLDNTFHKAGSKTMAEDANMYISGLYLMNARYQSVTNVDNIKVTIPGDYANTPVIALTGVNNSERTYTISFMEGETLHLTGTDGSQKTIGYYDTGEVLGQYVYTTTTSGTISAYTTVGTMTSETATMDVNCSPIVLPTPTYAVVSAAAGYEKVYQFTVDNSGVEMQPEIFMDFSFKSENGTDDFVLSNQNNGVKVTVPSKGTLTVTTKASGYASSTTSLMNDQSYEITQDIDLQHLTGADLLAKGFVAMDPLDSETTSGENNWTGRQRLYYQIENGGTDDEGKPTYDKYLVWGPSTVGGEPIQRYQYLQSNLNEETAHSLFAPLYLWYGTTGVDPSITKYFEEDGVTPKVDHLGHTAGTTNPKMYEGIGLCFSGNLGDGGDFYTNSTMTYAAIAVNNVTLGVDGLTSNDMILVSKITDYGSTSAHPQFPLGTDPAEAKNQYLASNLGESKQVISSGLETFQLYRVQDAITRVQVLSPGTSGIKDIVAGQVVSDHNAPIYNLNGVQVNAKSLKPGVYVKQGKKFIVR